MDMKPIQGTERDRLLLLPESVEDDVGPDNPVWFLNAFVDHMDLAGAGFARVIPEVLGRPRYDPADLLKLYIYDYLNRVRSSRRLEVECRLNIEATWWQTEVIFNPKILQPVKMQA